MNCVRNQPKETARVATVACAIAAMVMGIACGTSDGSEGISPVVAEDAGIEWTTDATAGVDALDSIQESGPDAEHDAASCDAFQVIRDYWTSKMASWCLASPNELCEDCSRAMDVVKNGETYSVEWRDFASNEVGSTEYHVKGIYMLATFIEPAGTSIVGRVDEDCALAELTCAEPQPYFPIQLDQAKELLEAYDSNLPSLREPYLVFYPASDCSYSVYMPAWCFEAEEASLGQWYVTQQGEVKTEIAKSMNGG